MRALGAAQSGPLITPPMVSRRSACRQGVGQQVLGRSRQLGCSPPPPPTAALRRTCRLRIAALTGNGARAAVSFDPDTYEEDSDDEDDYGEGIPLPGATSAPWQAGSRAAGHTEAASSSDAGPSETRARRGRRQRVGDTFGGSFALVLLFGHAVHRLLTRCATAVLATARVSWQLGGDALKSLRRNTVQAKSQAAESFARSPAGQKVQNWRKKLDAAQQDLPEDLWGKVMWVWDRPHMQKLRLTISMANFSIRLPALVALVATQIGLLSTSLSLPMLAPLLLGTGMLLRSIRTNASLIFPRIGLLVVLLWLLWFANSVIQNTVVYLRKQGAIDQRLANNINSAAELTVLVTAGVILLSMLGVNVSGLLLPAGVVAAIASRDLSHNFLAGFFLMMVQPFRLGDRVGVSLPAGSPGSFGAGGSWFEGVCEKVDLRYTSLRQGKRRLMVPNSAFLQQPFMILEDAPVGSAPPEAGPGPASGTGSGGINGSSGAGGYAEWQSYVNGMPVHQELAREAAGQAPVPGDAAAPSQEFLQQQAHAQQAQQAQQQMAQQQMAQQAQQHMAQQAQQHMAQQGPPPAAAAVQQQQQFSQQGAVPPASQYQQAFQHMHGPPLAPMGGMHGWSPQPGSPPYQPPLYGGGPLPGEPLPPYM
ncbi:hypothetical protein ABPG77_005307 [Micractinium sp. CCAP 211/92]